MRILLAATLLISASCFAEETNAYRTGGPEFAAAWHQFYDLSDHESEIDDPLIKKGTKMVPAIVEAVQNKDMKYRRYAIGALGYIQSRGALQALESILKDKSELEYFRGDALKSIYQIDRGLGAKYASKFRNENSYLKMVSEAISNNAQWLTEPSEE